MNPVHYSSKKQDWETPDDLFKRLDDEFHFKLDVCATRENRKVEHYFGPGGISDDGLSAFWGDMAQPCWMNPPYGKAISEWTFKARNESSLFKATVVALLPARTDTRWWHEDVIGGSAEVRFLKGRLKFKGAKYSAPFPSAIVVWRPKCSSSPSSSS
jgi:phage N-6-adenine-methyltransferase